MPASYLQLEPQEKIVLVRRRHFINIFPIFVSTVLLLAFFGFALGWVTANPELIQPPLSVPLVSLAIIGLAAFVVLVLVTAYLIYLQTRIILTTKYYVQITQNGLFGRTVSKLTLDEIQDVRGSKNGFLPTILNYGEILIETAGEEENFFFRPVGDPLELAETINDAHQDYEHKLHARPQGVNGSDLPKPPVTG